VRSVVSNAARTEDSVSGIKALAERYAEGDVVAGKYKLVRLLGRGGMGEVWLAHNVALDARVALKLINGEYAPSEVAEAGLGERLLEEARATAQLGHPAIVRVFDFGRTQKGDPMIVMEHLEGEDLAMAIDEHGPASALRAVRVLLPIIHGLAAVHAKGVVHRDIKPENIFLCQNESGQVQPKLVDFGIAKRAAKAAGRLTLSGMILGSPDYMSPEQAQGLEATAQSDLFSICVVLYELVIGVPPFAKEDVGAQLHAIANEEPMPFSGFEGAEPLWAIVARGLSKEPSARFASLRALGVELAGWAHEHGGRDDITGASLESVWLNVSTRGTNPLASILPPPPDPRFGSSPSINGPPESGPRVVRAEAHSQDASDLQVLAELHRGGDPVELMAREQRRRALVLGVVFGVISLAVAGAILLGAGVF
jgi:serine/threonine-protein kinase